MSRLLARLCLLVLLVSALAACNRSIVLLPTDEGGPNTPPPDKQRVALVIEATGEAEVRANADAEWSEPPWYSRWRRDQVRRGPMGYALLRTKARDSGLRKHTLAFACSTPFPKHAPLAGAAEGRVWCCSIAAPWMLNARGNFAPRPRIIYERDDDAGAGNVLVTCLQGTCYFMTSNSLKLQIASERATSNRSQ